MTNYGDPARTGWRDSALTRILGSAASWFLFSLSFTLLYLVSMVVMALGGSCASGGPYDIAVECPDNTVFAPLSIFGGLIAVAISVFLAQGFGVPLTTWAWPILFCGLAVAFLLAGGVVGYVIGGMFVLMGIVPLILEVRASVQRVFLGQRAANGTQFYEGDGARKSMMSVSSPNPEGAVRPTVAHWILSLAVAGLAIWGGYTVARIWFGPF